MESEYVAASQACKEGIWLRAIVYDIKEACGILKGEDVNITPTSNKPVEDMDSEEEALLDSIEVITNDQLPLDIPAQSILLLVDNQAAIAVANNPEDHNRSKHIDISFNFLRQRVALKQVELVYIPTKDQPADFTTKPLSYSKFAICKFNCGIKSLALAQSRRWTGGAEQN